MLHDNQERNNSIAVIIPAYNVEQYIKKVIGGLPSYIDFIIVIDDCSKNHTAQEINKIKDSRIHLIKHTKNKGVGGAMLSGYQVAYDLGADIMVKIDGDDQMDPQYIMPLLAPILDLEADYAKGNRFLHMKELQKMPIIRRIGNWGLSFLTKLASGYWNIFDPTNGYTALHREAYILLNKEAIDKDFFFETSTLIQLQRGRAVVRDVPIPAQYENQSSNLSPLRTFFTFPPKLFKNSLKRISFQYFLYDFTAVSVYLSVGIPSIIFGTIWGLGKWIASIRTGIVTSTGTVLIAVLPIIIGVQLLTQALSLDINNVPIISIRHK
ncbi:MAG: glycosyltransferase family 2 protein [Chloroflexi bacterium]|nr:glycosyltransferase family 2 protein [Chloroflexota bacterium]